MHEEKLRRTEERRQRILEAKVAKAAAKALKIQQIKERKQSLLTECSSGEEAQKKTDSAVSPNFGWKNQSNGWAKTIWQSNKVSPTRFETMKLMNLEQKQTKLESKMARVAENKQRILEERKDRARRSYESFFKTQRANSASD